MTIFKQILAASALLSLSFFPTASAQTSGQDQTHTHAEDGDHAGHNHGKAENYPIPMALPDIDHVYTESPNDHVIGSPTAPVTVIGYVSVTCGHCSQWFKNDWPLFKSEHIDTGNIRFVLRELPTPPAQVAMIGFLIANCAPKDTYFDHITHQMDVQTDTFQALKDGKARETFNAFGKKAGLETEEEVQACLERPEGMTRLRKANLRANAANVNSVPYFMINGEAVSKDQTSAEALSKLINAKLNGGVSSVD